MLLSFSKFQHNLPVHSSSAPMCIYILGGTFPANFLDKDWLCLANVGSCIVLTFCCVLVCSVETRRPVVGFLPGTRKHRPSPPHPVKRHTPASEHWTFLRHTLASDRILPWTTHSLCDQSKPFKDGQQISSGD